MDWISIFKTFYIFSLNIASWMFCAVLSILYKFEINKVYFSIYGGDKFFVKFTGNNSL